MEAWSLADQDALRRHFGHNFDDSKLPRPELAETRAKADIGDLLQSATRRTKAKEYRKIRDGAKLLERLDPPVVRKHCKWCDRLFRTLGSAVGAEL